MREWESRVTAMILIVKRNKGHSLRPQLFQGGLQNSQQVNLS